MDIYNFFRNVCSPLRNKDITAFLRHPEQCLIPSPQIAFCFTNLSCLVLEIFKFFEKHAQNLNIQQNNSARWDLIRYGTLGVKQETRSCVLYSVINLIYLNVRWLCI
jgi:hypothetical protein